MQLAVHLYRLHHVPYEEVISDMHGVEQRATKQAQNGTAQAQDGTERAQDGTERAQDGTGEQDMSRLPGEMNTDFHEHLSISPDVHLHTGHIFLSATML